MSGLHGSAFHHCAPPASRNHVIRHVNAVITHHYPEVQVSETPSSPASPPAVEADVPHLFTASGREVNTHPLRVEPKGRVGGYSPTLDQPIGGFFFFFRALAPNANFK